MATRLPVHQPDVCCSDPVTVEPLAPAIQADLLAVFKALGDATRLEVFRFVASQSEAICACDIVDRFDVSQPTIAHHMKVLREADLVTVSRRGVWAYYEATPGGVELLEQALSVTVRNVTLLARAS